MVETSNVREAPNAPRATARKRRVWLWVAGTLAGLAMIWCVGGLILVGVFSGGRNVSLSVGDAVAVIYIEGTIGASSLDASGSVNSETIIGYIRQAESDRRIKAIVVAINSPGGAVVPSDEMYRALREAQKPVVASMGDVAASGGYYVACGADKILAHPATLTGSIGVYSQLVNAADLFKKLGVEGIIVRSGDVKAAGNLFEHPTPEQLAIQQAIVDELHSMFVGIVSDARGMDEEQVRSLADGRPFTGQQAVGLGLVDGLGTLEDAIREAANLGGIIGKPQIVEYRYRTSFLDLWMSGRQLSEPDSWLGQWLNPWLGLPQMRYIGP